MGEALREIWPRWHAVAARLFTGPCLALTAEGTPGLGLLKPLGAALSSHRLSLSHTSNGRGLQPCVKTKILARVAHNVAHTVKLEQVTILIGQKTTKILQGTDSPLQSPTQT